MKEGICNEWTIRGLLIEYIFLYAQEMEKSADEQINGIYYVLRKWKYIMSTC